MKILKKLNNNVACGIDKNKRALIVFGKGIGFPSMPYELSDLKIIDRTYYDIDTKYLGLLEELPEAIFEVSSKIIDCASSFLNCELNPNLLFTLADHLHFAVERFKKHMDIRNPLSYDVEQLYPKEMDIGIKALDYIETHLEIRLPRYEAASVALHIVNAEAGYENIDEVIKVTKILKEVTKIIESSLNIEIDETSYSYARFIIHLRYFIMRRQNDSKISSENKHLFEMTIMEYPQTYKCILNLETYFSENLKWSCDEEEFLYLMLHVNRLCSKGL